MLRGSSGKSGSKRVVAVLDGLGVGYMVTGSVTSGLQGEPRSTHDIDVVVDLTVDSAERLRQACSVDDYSVSEPAIRQPLSERTKFNVVEMTTGDKVDFWNLTDEPFDRSRFSRRRFVDVLGLRFPVSAPEDTILMKLRWAVLSGGSEKQFRDALRVYEVQYGILDVGYLQAWVAPLGVESLWQRLCTEARPL
jgi:hypothetical protein